MKKINAQHDIESRRAISASSKPVKAPAAFVTRTPKEDEPKKKEADSKGNQPLHPVPQTTERKAKGNL